MKPISIAVWPSTEGVSTTGAHAADRLFKGLRPPQVGLEELDVEPGQGRWRAAVANDRADGLPTFLRHEGDLTWSRA